MHGDRPQLAVAPMKVLAVIATLACLLCLYEINREQQESDALAKAQLTIGTQQSTLKADEEQLQHQQDEINLLHDELDNDGNKDIGRPQ